MTRLTLTQQRTALIGKIERAKRSHRPFSGLQRQLYQVMGKLEKRWTAEDRRNGAA